MKYTFIWGVRTYVETCSALLRDHIVSATLAVFIAAAYFVGGVLWLLAGFDEVVRGNVGFGRAA